MITLTELLKIQTIDAQNWTKKLINEIPEEKWFITPDTIETNFAWQIGHLTLSQYYYTIVLINGQQNDLSVEFPVKKYSNLFAKGEKKRALLPEVSVKELLCNLELIHHKTLQTIAELNVEDLLNAVVATSKPHPFVKNKQESISWNIKHTMMHCGQMAMLKRVIDKPFDYGF